MMKFLLATVTALVVFTADGRHFRDEPGEQVGKTDETQLFPDETDGQGGPQYSPNGPKQDHQLEKKTKQHERKSQKTQCKRSDVCGVMGGICVTNATLCGGRLVPEGCKGKNCQCCISGTIEAKFDKLEKYLNDSLNSELQSLNSKIDSLLNIYDHTTLESTTVSESSETSVQTTTVSTACNQGFFRLNASNCYKFFTDSKISWTAAKTKCHSEGLVLAKPYNAVELRAYLVQNYGDKRSWIGARGSGSTINWDRDGSTLSTSNSLWWPGYPGSRTSSTSCVVFASDTSHMSSQPNKPYYINSCTSHTNYPLCERLMG